MVVPERPNWQPDDDRREGGDGEDVLPFVVLGIVVAVVIAIFVSALTYPS